jgi:hypothetical protein
VYVWQTIKGSGLALRFKSGRSKGLTMSLDTQTDLDPLYAILNYYLNTSRGRSRLSVSDIPTLNEAYRHTLRVCQVAALFVKPRMHANARES